MLMVKALGERYQVCVEGNGIDLLNEFSVLVYSMVMGADISETLIRTALAIGLDKDFFKEDKPTGNDILEKYLAELSSRVLGEPS